jgi:hypothetical protein
MIETKDPAIKLFGKKILFPGEVEALIIDGDENVSPPSAMVVEEEERDFAESENEEEEEEETEKVQFYSKIKIFSCAIVNTSFLHD